MDPISYDIRSPRGVLPRPRSRLLAWLAAALFFTASAADDIWTPFKNGPEYTTFKTEYKGFKTEPDFWLDDFHVQRMPKNTSVLAPGYLFMNAMINAPPYGFGQSIYTNEGELIWQHDEHVRRKQNIHVCDYMGEVGNHICYYTRGPLLKIPNLPEPLNLGRPETTYGWLMVMDNTYKRVARNRYGFEQLSVNGHAYETWNNGTKLTTVVGRPRTIDMSPYGGSKNYWVTNQCIQEMDIQTGNDDFHWCYLEAGLPWEASYSFPGNTTAAKKAFVREKPELGRVDDLWDFMHANSVWKNDDGDYLMSARQLNQIIKVAGKKNKDEKPPGTVLWRLGGKENDFKFVNFNKWSMPQGFARQHDARSIWVNGSRELVSLFNNAWDSRATPIQPFSEGMFIEVNTDTWEAELVRSYPHPFHKQTEVARDKKLSWGRGNTQLLPNDNVMVGWGTLPHATEFDKDGNVLYHMKYTRKQGKGIAFSYRIFRYPWVGKPYWPPRIIAYSNGCKNSRLTAYVSWNGATEVKKWKIWTKKRHGLWTARAIIKKNGFETTYTISSDSNVNENAYVKVEALDANDEVLGTSLKTPTFVPQDKYAEKCDHVGCTFPFRYIKRNSKAWMCYEQSYSSYVAAALVFVVLEALVFYYQRESPVAEARSRASSYSLLKEAKYIS